MTVPQSPGEQMELQPCPFCGGTAWLKDLGGWEAGCNTCSAIVSPDYPASKEMAIAVWNARPPTPQPAESAELVRHRQPDFNVLARLDALGEILSHRYAGLVQKHYEKLTADAALSNGGGNG